MEEIRELLSRIDTLTTEELSRLNELINQQFDVVSAADPTAETVAAMDELASGLETARARETAIQEEAAAIAERAESARARMDALRNPTDDPLADNTPPVEGEGDDDAAGEGDDEGDDTPDVPVVEGAEGDAVDEPAALPLAAGAGLPGGLPAGAVRPRAAAMAARHGRARPSPEPVVAAAGRPIVRAGAGLRDLNPGDFIESGEVLHRAMVDMLDGLDRDAPSSGKHVVARADWRDAYPADRRLGPDASRNTELISAVCAPQALVASGGVCLPVNVDYSVPTWAGADRPFRDSLPAFQADRGGLRFVAPPDIGVPSLQAAASGLGSATSVWTEATDANPAGATKPVYQVLCGTEQLVYVNAIPTRLQFGNMQGRFAPEQIAAQTDLAIAVAAREAELELLTLAYNDSKQVKPQQYLGATRDLLASVDLLIEQYRYSHRIPPTTQFDAVFPEWAKGVIRADLARELAHDQSGSYNPFAVTDEMIEGWFSTRGINITWTLDGLKAGTYGTGGSAITNQFFSVLGTNAPEPQWPGETSDGSFQLAWLLYPEGSLQFLDGGRLDLGVVRDSTLDATNDYETFVETFEGLALRGLEIYQVQSTILPNGGSGGSVAVSGYHE
jgi:hypothetical protein